MPGVSQGTQALANNGVQGHQVTVDDPNALDLSLGSGDFTIAFFVFFSSMENDQVERTGTYSTRPSLAARVFNR